MVIHSQGKFEWIEEWHAESERKYLIGVLPFRELRENNWWRETIRP